MLLACLLLTPPLVGCGSTEDNAAAGESDTASADDLPAESTVTEPVETAPPMGVPAGKTFDGESISIWYTTTSVSVAETYLDLAGELTGDALDDGMYDRNLKVQDILDVVLDYHDMVDVKSSETGAALEKLVRAGDTTYDLYSLVQWNGAKYAYQNMFYNMKNAPYVSFDKPWWNYNYMKEMTIGEDKIYCMVGDVSVDSTRCLSCVYYNKAMYDDYYQDADGLYDVVLEGDWNLDLLMQIAEQVYEDKNGNKRTATEIVTDNVFFTGAKSSNSGSGSTGYNENSYAAPAPAQPAYTSGAASDFEEVESDNDLPF